MKTKYSHKKIEKLEFVAIENVNYELVDFDADKKSAKSTNDELFKKIRDFDPANKVVIIKVYGELASGKTTDIDFSAIRDELKQKGALQIEINRNQLLSKEYNISAAPGKNKTEIETNVFKENIGQLRNKQSILLADSGISLAKKWQKEHQRFSDYYSWLVEYFIPSVDQIEKQVLHSIWQNFNEVHRRWYSILIDDVTKESRIDEEFSPIIEQDGFE